VDRPVSASLSRDASACLEGRRASSPSISDLGRGCESNDCFLLSAGLRWSLSAAELRCPRSGSSTTEAVFVDSIFGATDVNDFASWLTPSRLGSEGPAVRSCGGREVLPMIFDELEGAVETVVARGPVGGGPRRPIEEVMFPAVMDLKGCCRCDCGCSRYPAER
jgi:hypothetical protein